MERYFINDTEVIQVYTIIMV